MFDFSRVEEIELEYEFVQYEEISYYSETPNSRVVSPNRDVIRITIQDNDRSLDNTTYQLILMKRDGKIFVKGDYFEIPEEWYQTIVTLNSDHALIVSEDEKEIMRLRCYLS